MDDSGIQDALRALDPDEIDAIERFVDRLRQDGWIHPEAADRWRLALDGSAQRHARRRARL